MNITAPANLQIALDHGLTEDEFESICKILGRDPNVVEVGIYSALWSEHCSYKNSILHLKTFPSEGKHSLTAAGEENAGVVDIGDGLALAFKVESHNHPTAVEPYQGAATGVGGIMRDIFTMGARPITTLNSLRFGRPDGARNEYLLRRAVKGIGDYGNSLGITVSGGELFFDDSYSTNPLVNAMTVGVMKTADLQTSVAKGVGNPVMMVGATTGRDGIHGASFASTDLTEESEEKRSAVQVGDPFMEKLLLEATLELIATGYIESIQDMGAAGLSCSSSEMAAKGNLGMDLDLDKVPVREAHMNAYEIMLSESQERMLIVAKEGREADIKAIFEKWDLEAVVIGQTNDNGMLNIYQGGQLQAQIPAESLVLGGGAPRYKREFERPAELDRLAEFSVKSVSDLAPNLVRDFFLKFIGSPNMASKRPLFDQYDTSIGNASLVFPGADGGLHRIHDSNKAIATTLDCNSRYVSLDPYSGAALAVVESIRNLAVRGCYPLGITNCLNFANPYKPENYYFFAESIRGIGDACRFFEIPVTGGNVSFYNESPQGPVLPTPTIGTVGLIEDYTKGISSVFKQAGDSIYLVGQFAPSIGAGEYLSFQFGERAGRLPALNLELEKKLAEFIVAAIDQRHLQSASDLSLGGLLPALAKCLLEADYAQGPLVPSGLGLEIDLSNIKVESGRLDDLLFGETAASYIVSVDETNRSKFEKSCSDNSVSAIRLGQVTNNEHLNCKVQTPAGGAADYSWQNEELRQAYHQGLAPFFHLLSG